MCRVCWTMCEQHIGELWKNREWCLPHFGEQMGRLFFLLSSQLFYTFNLISLKVGRSFAGIFHKWRHNFFRSRAFTRKGSLEVNFFNTYFPYVRKFCDIHFFVKLNYGSTPHMTIYGAQVDRKLTGSTPEVECKGCTASEILTCQSVFL